MNRLAAVLMLVIAVYCVARLVASRWLPMGQRLGSVMHGTMAVVMAGMYTPELMLPGPVAVPRAVFAGFAVSSLIAHRGQGRLDPMAACAHRDHALSAAAMLYMLTPRTGVPAMVEQSAAVGFTAVLVVVAVQWTARTLRCARDLATTAPRPGFGEWFVAPVGPMGCDAVMASVMAVMIYTGG